MIIVAKDRLIRATVYKLKKFVQSQTAVILISHYVNNNNIIIIIIKNNNNKIIIKL